MQFQFSHVLMNITGREQQAGLLTDLVVHGTQQLSKPVEGLELPADPHKIQPLQPETPPAITACTAGRGREDRSKHTNTEYSNRSPVVSV